MSPERGSGRASLGTQRVRLEAAPAGVRLAAGRLEDSLERHVVEREQRARAEGRREGEAAANAGAAAALDAAVLRLDGARESALDDLAHTAVDLAVEIARELLRVELPAGRYDLEGMVRQALSFSSVKRGRCVVHLNPSDATRLADARFRAGTELEPDEGIPRGSVHVTTPQGLLVRDLDEALRSIAERLHEEVR